MPQSRVNVFESKIGTVAYYDEGEGSPILFGHSYLWNKDMWTDVVSNLKGSFRCIVPDVFGHGDSGVDREASLESIADSYVELMASLEIEKFAVVGLSLGGMWGSVMAGKYPEKLSHLVIFNSSLTSEPEDKAGLYNQLLGVLESIQSIPEPVIAQIGPGFFGNGVSEERRQKFYHELQSTPAENIDTIVAVGRSFVNRGRLLDHLKDFEGKTSVIAGLQDQYRSIEESQEVCDELEIELKYIDAGHISSIERPEYVVAKIKESLG